MAEIAHVVVLMLENRSFDHLLGYVPHPDPAFDGLLGRTHRNPGWQRGPAVAASPTAKKVLPVGPDHSHDAVMQQLALRGGQPTNQGFVRSYERKARNLDPPVFGGLLGPAVNWISRVLARRDGVKGRGPLVMACQPPENVPVLAKLATEFAVCSRWFCSVPGETWPNRNFAHAATSDGQTEIVVRDYTNRTIFELLQDAGADWRIYHDDTPQVWAFPALWATPKQHAKWFRFDQFADHVAAGELTEYTFIEPNHRPPLHTLDHAPLIGTPDLSDSQHPENNLVSDAAYDDFTLTGASDFTRAESLIATIYEALRAQPDVFDKTLLLITYDEHGGLYDHVPPPTGVHSPGGEISKTGRAWQALLQRKTAAFDFTMYGPRVPAVVISPRIPAGTVDSVPRDHASIPATLRTLFAPDAEPLTARDRFSPTFHELLTLPEPRTDLPNLSEYATELTMAIEASAMAASALASASATAALAETPPVPDYYKPFLTLAGQVQERLAAVGEPESAEPVTGPAALQGTQITQEFADAADRHRQSP
ncbi:MAG TPA: alkaline phosphatase family protein [Streptosporangiaceae bacterium]|nr:alkaline phosphatase family protein [Streptosporangiaceae bacterium]